MLLWFNIALHTFVNLLIFLFRIRRRFAGGLRIYVLFYILSVSKNYHILASNYYDSQLLLGFFIISTFFHCSAQIARITVYGTQKRAKNEKWWNFCSRLSGIMSNCLYVSAFIHLFFSFLFVVFYSSHNLVCRALKKRLHFTLKTQLLHLFLLTAKVK